MIKLLAHFLDLIDIGDLTTRKVRQDLCPQWRALDKTVENNNLAFCTLKQLLRIRKRIGDPVEAIFESDRVVKRSLYTLGHCAEGFRTSRCRRPDASI